MRNAVIFLFSIGFLCAAPSSREKIVGYFIQVNENTLGDLPERISRVKSAGYNTLILSLYAWNAEYKGGAPSYQLAMGAGMPTGVSTQKLKEIIEVTRRQGLEPIFEIKTVGKVVELFGALSQQYPNIIYRGKHNSVWNPRFIHPDGGDLETSILKPLIAELLGCYGDRPAKFMHIGVDEVDKGALADAGKAEGLTAGQFLGREINRIVRIVTSHGITPVMFQDMLMSPELGNAGVVQNFNGDLRLKHYEPMNGSRKAFGGGNVMDAVDIISNKKAIIIADWHYFGGAGAEGKDYPSIDYFQRLGFKDVWGIPWYDMDTTVEFSRYASERSCGGMAASVWFIDLKKRYADLQEQILINSVTYFKFPKTQRTISPSMRVTDKKGLPVVVGRPGQQITVSMYGEAPSMIDRITFFIRTGKIDGWDEFKLATSMNPPQASFVLPDKAGLFCDAKVEVRTRDGLIHLGLQTAAVCISP